MSTFITVISNLRNKGMKLSIITINFNNVSGLLKTIESVISQTFRGFEYIVIDGGSSDGSVEVIKEYADKITCWVSEPDNGIYNAMNKGVLKATGEYCLFLNSGDWFVDNEVVKDFINSNFNDDIISGNLILLCNERSEIRYAIKKEDLGFEHLFNNRIPHPATFIKRLLFDKYGLYNENFKIVSDWEFFLKCLIVFNCTYSHIDRLVSNYDLNGISSNPKYMLLQETEKEETFQKYVPRIYKSFKKYETDLEELRSHENDYREYVNLKLGKTSSIVKLLLFIKKILKK